MRLQAAPNMRGSATASLSRPAVLTSSLRLPAIQSVTRTLAVPPSTETAASTQAATVEALAPWAEPGYKGAAISALPLSAQTAVFAGIFASLGAATYVNTTILGPAVSAMLPSWLQVTATSWFPLGPVFLAAGVAHFTQEQGFLDMYPHRGAWGIWQLPGSPKFHVQWTGVAEILGGLGLMIGALPVDQIRSLGLSQLAAFGLFFLTIAVTPANVYMATHNAPGPLPKDAPTTVIPPAGHAARWAMQVLLLSALWGIAADCSTWISQ